MQQVQIRDHRAGEEERIAFIVRRAFGGEAEARLVADLRKDGDMVRELVAEHASDGLIGYIAFSRLTLRSAERTITGAALAPLAVLPTQQRRGAGLALVEQGLTQLREARIDVAVVLGDPGYYSRFGFSALLARLLQAPYSGDGLQALELSPNILGRRLWTCTYPPAFATLS